MVDAACYVITGVVCILLGSAEDTHVPLILIGIGSIAYGIKVAFFTVHSYWVTSWIYVVTFFAVLYFFRAFDSS